MNSKKINILLLSLLISFISLAQNPKRIFTSNIFKGMEASLTADIDNEFGKAKEDFDKILVKDPESAMANLGLAIVYSYDKYSNKDYCTALEHFNKAYKAQSQFTSGDQDVINELVFIQDHSRRNKPFTENMDWLKQETEDKLIKFIREEKNSDYAKRFLQDFPSSRYYRNVSHILSYIKFREAENENTVDAFNQFLKDYPEAAQVEMAEKMRNKLAYNTAISEGSLKSYQNYIENYPDAEHVGEIKNLLEEMAFKDAYNKHTLEAIERFIINFPNSSKISKAKVLQQDLLFEWAKRENNIEAYNKFVASCTEGNRYIDIFNLKANVLAEQIAKEFPDGNYEFVKVFDNQQLNDFGGGIAKRTNGELVVAASSRKAVGEMYDSWLLGLDSSGKMIWNKFLGNRFDDIVNKVCISDQNEIYVAGITGAIVDSLKGQAWLYKLDSDGNNIFNQGFDIDEVLDFVVYPNNKVLIAGYSKDTKESTSTPNLVKINANGKKLWTRAYSNKGKVYSLANDALGITYAAAGNWIFAIDQAGYLKWDILLDKDIKHTAVDINANNKIVFAGLNASGVFVNAYNRDGEKLWESLIDTSSENGDIEQVIPLPDNSFVVAGTFNNKIKVTHIDETGAIKSSKEYSLPEGIKLNGLTTTDDNFVVISATRLMEKSDLIVFKFAL
nr:hypothetical protein [uncultured Carboxylicivirga sp.]